MTAPFSQRLRRLGAVAAVSVGLLLGLGVISGLGSGWVRGLTVPATVSTPLSVTTLTDGLLGGTGAVRTLGTVVSLVAVAVVALRWHTGDRSRALQAVAVVTGVVVVLGPVVHLWYLLWVVPFLAVLRLTQVAMAGLLAASTVFGLVAPLDSSLHEAYDAIVLGSVIVGLLVPLLLLTRRSRRRIERIVSAEWIPHPRAGSTLPVTSPSAIRPPEVPGAA